MFYDWIKAYQDYPFDLPKVGDVICRRFDVGTEELLSTSVPAFFAEGSYCTTFRIHVCGRRITVDGNASRLNRLDNVFGIETLDGCMRVINAVLVELGLPEMTKCKNLQRLQDGSVFADGAVSCLPNNAKKQESCSRKRTGKREGKSLDGLCAKREP